jgi:hypothetical protein
MSLVISSTTDDQAAVNAAAGITEEAEETTQQQPTPESARPPKAPPVEVPEEEEEETEEPDEGEEDPGKEEPKKKLGGWQRKIQKLEEANTYAYRRLAQLEDQLKPKEQQPQGPPPRPTLEQFPDNYDAYIEALADWKTDRKLEVREQENLKKAQEWQQREAERATVETWQTRLNDFRSKTKDFDTVLSNADDIELHPVIRQSLLNYEHGPQLAYELARNRPQLEKIAAISNPLDAIRELGRFEATLTAGPPPRIETRKPFTAPPEPIRPVGKGSNGNVHIPLDKLPLRDYIKAREREIKARKAR